MNKTDTNEDNKTIDLDAYWKVLITELLEEGVELMHPILHDAVDWTILPVFLEQELINALKGKFKIKDKRKFTDKLAKLRLKSGEDHFVLLHAEAQHEPEADFKKRMYVYRSLIYLWYDMEDITALAIFTGAPPDPKSLEYYHKCFGTELIYRFISYIIATQSEKKLLASDNPFAVAVLAVLYTYRTVNDAERRFAFKRKVYELAQKKNISREKLTKLLNFVNDFMHLPEPLEKEFEASGFANFLNYQNMVNLNEPGHITMGTSEGSYKIINEFVQRNTGKTLEDYRAESFRIDEQKKAIKAEKRKMQAKLKQDEVKRKQAEKKAKQAENTAKQAENTAKQAEITAKQAENTAKQAEITAKQAEITAKQAENIAKQIEIKAEQERQETIFNLYSKAGLSMEMIATTMNLELNYVQNVITDKLK